MRCDSVTSACSRSSTVREQLLDLGLLIRNGPPLLLDRFQRLARLGRARLGLHLRAATCRSRSCRSCSRRSISLKLLGDLVLAPVGVASRLVHRLLDGLSVVPTRCATSRSSPAAVSSSAWRDSSRSRARRCPARGRSALLAPVQRVLQRFAVLVQRLERVNRDSRSASVLRKPSPIRATRSRSRRRRVHCSWTA